VLVTILLRIAHISLARTVVVTIDLTDGEAPERCFRCTVASDCFGPSDFRRASRSSRTQASGVLGLDPVTSPNNRVVGCCLFASSTVVLDWA